MGAISHVPGSSTACTFSSDAGCCKLRSHGWFGWHCRGSAHRGVQSAPLGIDERLMMALPSGKLGMDSPPFRRFIGSVLNDISPSILSTNVKPSTASPKQSGINHHQCKPSASNHQQTQPQQAPATKGGAIRLQELREVPPVQWPAVLPGGGGGPGGCAWASPGHGEASSPNRLRSLQH